MKTLVLALPDNEDLRDALVEGLAAEAGQLESRRFPDGETYLRVLSAVAGRDVVIACNLVHPDDKLLRVYLLASTLRDLGARRIVLVAPYLAYMRQDRAFNKGEGISAKYLGRWLSEFLDGLVTVEPHLHRIHALSEVYSIPSVAVHVAGAVGRWIASNVRQPLLIGPDEESTPWVQQAAQGAGCPYLILKKVRLGDREVRVSLPGIGAYPEHTPVVLDDIISTGRTMLETIRQLHAVGMASPVCIGVHALFSDDADEHLRHAGAQRVVTCNTVRHHSNEIDLHREMAVNTRSLLADLAKPSAAKS